MKDIIELKMILDDIINIISQYEDVETTFSYSDETNSGSIEVICYIKRIKTAEVYEPELELIAFHWDKNMYHINGEEIKANNPYKAFKHFLDYVKEAVDNRDKEVDRSNRRDEYNEHEFNRSSFMKSF